MRRTITDTGGGTRTYLLELASGQSACGYVPMTRDIPKFIDRAAFRMLAKDLRKQMPKVTYKRTHIFEMIEGGYKEPPKQHKGRSPFWTPLTWSPKGAA